MDKNIQAILNLTNSIQTQVVENPEQIAALERERNEARRALDEVIDDENESEL